MLRLIAIGTLHAGVTPEQELIEVLESYTPNRLLVEIADTDIQSGKIDSYPPEMIAAYQWANKKDIDVRGFDSKVNVLREGLNESDSQRAIKEQKEAMGTLTWKDCNKEENLKKLAVTQWLIDPVKSKKRTEEMMRNLKELMITEGTVVIVTGCGNLNSVRMEFSKAEFPLA